MPYWFETERIRFPRRHDKRVKLTDAQREAVLLCGLSIRKAAALYGVSRRTIQFIRHPEKQAQNKARFQERGGWRQYYDKEKHRISSKKRLQHKKEVFGLKANKKEV